MTHDALEMVEYRDDPAVLIFADGAMALERARRAAERAGCRVVAAAPIEDALKRLEQQASSPPLYIELSEDGASEALVSLLDRVQAEAVERSRPSLVIAPAALTDLVAARISAANVIHQCDPTQGQRLEALLLITKTQPARLHDVGREGTALLQQLSEEVGRIANILASLSEDEAAEPERLRPSDGDKAEPPVDAAQIRAIIRARRLRDQYFRGNLFADPAWDMLLDLMAARLEKSRVAVSSLCIAAAVPATTALRWIKALTDRGLFVRSADPQDGRRVYIELSEETARALAAYLRAAQRLAPAVI